MSHDTYDVIKRAVEEALDADGYRSESGEYVIMLDRGKVTDIVALTDDQEK